MSEPTTSVRLAHEPTAVRLGRGPDALSAFIDERLQEAREEGRRQGFLEGQASVAEILGQTNEAVAQAHTVAEEELAMTTIFLARSIARQILRTEIAEGRYDLERIVRECLASSGVGRGQVTVHLNPADAASLADVSFRSATTIESDVEVARGDVHVETPMGTLIRDVDQLLATIVERIRSETGA